MTGNNLPPNILETTADCEIVSSRVINFPIDLVFRAWTEPDHLKNWWGPAGFTNTFYEFDLRVGGRWRFMVKPFAIDKNEENFDRLEAELSKMKL